MTMRRALFVTLVVSAAAWLSPACGGDSESDNNPSSGGGGTGGGTDASPDTASGGMSGGGTGATGGTGGSGGSGACQDSLCPGLSVAGFNIPGCCLDGGACGYNGSMLGYGCLSQEDVQALLDGGLTPPNDAADPNCPSYTVFGQTAVGCCPATGMCGVYDPIINKKCLDWSEVPNIIPKPDGYTPIPCGDAAASDSGSDALSDASADAGSDASGDAAGD